MTAAPPPAARILGQFASQLAPEIIPVGALARARECLIDTIGVAYLGRTFPWSASVAGVARAYGGKGESRIIGDPTPTSAPFAALVNGTYAHAFEFDSLRQPGVGVHPGASLVPSALAIADEVGATGMELLASIVAGSEVMFRVGAASKHSLERAGFHAPGITGPFGAAVSAGYLLRLDPLSMSNALGIAGSLGGGLLAFAKASNGAMIKRLHLGRAAEAGVLAARLAQAGYEGPDSVLEGKFGFLDAYCEEADASLLTRDLGHEYEIGKLCLKRYPCHISAHTALHSIEVLRHEHNFDGESVASIAVRASNKVLSHHSNRDPRDLMDAQYSVPFCVAIALFHDPREPGSFSETVLADPRVRGVASRVKLSTLDEELSRSSWSSEVLVTLKNGKELAGVTHDFPGTPSHPAPPEALRDKFLTCTRHSENAQQLLELLETIETLPDVRGLRLA